MWSTSKKKFKDDITDLTVCKGLVQNGAPNTLNVSYQVNAVGITAHSMKVKDTFYRLVKQFSLTLSLGFINICIRGGDGAHVSNSARLFAGPAAEKTPPKPHIFTNTHTHTDFRC